MTLPPGAIRSFEIVAFVTGVAYAVLAARRNRLCWIAGAVSAACTALVSAMHALPMQAGLQVFYLIVAAYGWWSWTRSRAEGELVVGVWPWSLHALAIAVVIGLSFATAKLFAAESAAAWPLLDSLIVWSSLLATWLAARARLENWLYWVVIDAACVFLFYVQDLQLLALLNVLFVGIATAGFMAWWRRFKQQLAPAVAA